MSSLGKLIADIVERVRALPTGFQVVLGVAVVAALGVGSVFMYQTYDYVQHDNQFCMECHLMRDPFERFAQSAHQGLGCKACHRPNIMQRSEMGLAQIVEQPDSIRVHAHVSNEICAECHIEGNPEEWRIIANTAGHRVHFESEDPALEGLNCVECHSSGVHQFTPTDQTCGQGGCHESTDIQLGEMADLTIHCATCHDFAKPVEVAAGAEQLATSLRPQADECLSCHQMRAILPDMPADEPHNAECGACHNPHVQTTPRQAVESCATGGCHAVPDTLTPFHRDLDPGVLEDCLACHPAHEFRIHGGGQDCLSCHTDIFDDVPPQQRRSGAIGAASTGSAAIGSAATAQEPVRLASAGPVDPALARLALAAHASPQSPAQREAAQRDSVGFWHSQHQGVECTACHSTRESHGAVTVTSIRDCRSCHHTGPPADNCQSCHEAREVRNLRAEVRRTMEIRIGGLDRPTRVLPFRHAVHEDLDCAECHTSGLSLTAAEVNCSSCHEQHHRPANECMACHAQPADGVHNLDVHLGCGGSGCHEAAPALIQQVPRTRNFCMVCHQDMTDHRPGRNCADCHSLPSPREVAATDGPTGLLHGEAP
ncbi:MAG: NapC/NirT family cytochrome c [Longimicrobiales bacterium]